MGKWPPSLISGDLLDWGAEGMYWSVGLRVLGTGKEVGESLHGKVELAAKAVGPESFCQREHPGLILDGQSSG